MAADQFNSLVEAATKGTAAGRTTRSPRLIRARHHARWTAGVLAGRTELVIEAAGSGPADFLLEPWSPAILPNAQTAKVLGARDSGRTSLWIDQSPIQTVVLDWELKPRSHPHGRSFTLALPGDETTVLELDVPKDWIPSSRQGRRRGPRPAADPSRNLWEIEAESGRIDLHLYDPDEQGESYVGNDPWLTSMTQIDLRGTSERADGLANWTTDWRIELDPRNLKQIEIELDPGLELIGVQGPAVRGYRTERSGSVTRLVVTIDSDRNSSTLLRFLAHVQVPSEGPWTIPAMRPINATWTGGTTSVILDDFHVLQQCREKAGRRIYAPRQDSASGNRLEFESESPQPVAELVFRKPGADSSCQVRGQLFIGGSPSRVECQLNWTLHQGSWAELDIDLSAAWLPDLIRIRGLEDPLVWHPSVLPSGGTRLHVALPAASLSQQELALVLAANSTIPGGRGPLELPRVRPVGARIVDEAWVAYVDSGTMIQPTSARGLAWIDPGEVPGLLVPRGSGSDLREALAWRWIADSALARVDRERIEQEPRASIRVTARVDPHGDRLSLDGRLIVSSGAESLDSIPFWINLPGGSLESWHFADDDGGVFLAPGPIDEPTRLRLGFPKEGSVRSLVVKIPSHTEKTIHFHAEYSWNAHGSIPLVALPKKYLLRGMILVESPAGIRTRVETAGLRRLDPSMVNDSAVETDLDDDAGNRPDRSVAGGQVVHAYAYTDVAARLDLSTELLTPSPSTGIIREAFLTTSVDPKGSSMNRLRLLVSFAEARSLDLVPSPKMTLIRVRRDGSDVVPSQSKAGISIPIPWLSQGPRSSTIILDYAVADGPIVDGAAARPELPGVSLSCLSFVWELVTPPDWKAVDRGPGLVAGDQDRGSDWPIAALGLGKWPWSFPWGRRTSRDSDRLRQLDERLVDSVSDELTFSEWLSRWDSGTWPIVIDRLALSSAGFGPKSQCVPSRVKGERADISLTTLRRYGLALVPFPNVLVITTEAEASKFEPRDRVSEAIVESMIWGSDRSDRFQALARWRGEPSLKIAPAGGDETAGRVKLPPGWSTWRFLRPGLPANDSFVYLIDTKTRIISGWIVAGLWLTAWLWCRRRLGRWRCLVPTVLLAGSLLIDGFLPSRHASECAGIFAGSMVILILELGRRASHPRTSRLNPVRSESSLLRGVGTSAAGLLVVGLLLLRIGSAQVWGQPAQATAILAFFPYEGAFDPGRPAERVILRLDDYERLSRLARAAAAPSGSSVRAVSALHRVLRRSAQDIVVESELELAAFGPGPFSWAVPIAFARDIEVTLDRKSIPVSIEAGGAKAIAAIPSAGSHMLRVRRSTGTKIEAGHETLDLPVNAMPSARVILAACEDGQPPGELNARGGTELQSDRSLAGRLGPADRIEIRWPRPVAARAETSAATVEGLILWDINPAGDRVRARLTYNHSGKLSAVRLAHEPGLILRSTQIPGSADAFWEENANRDEWTLRIDPPLPAGSTIALDCWRPLGASRARADTSPTTAGAQGEPIRALPRIHVVGVERYSGTLGVRRPGDWVGRLDPLPNSEPISDESFVKAWGTLPDERLTLCGTSRFVRECRASLRTSPTPTRIQIKPTVHVQIESGRIAMTVDAELAELAGHLRQVEAELPEDIRVIQVTAEGLTDWTVSADRRLQLRFDKPIDRPRRRIHIFAWIPLSDEPLKVGSRQHRIRAPWIWWDDKESNTGSLTISSISKLDMLGSAGLTLITSESSPASGTSPSRHQLTYRVDDPRRLGEISWESVPPRVSVSIESQVTIHPDTADWVAVLRYDVIGGPLDAIHLEMPAEWAARAEVHLAGIEYQLTAETRGPSAFWSITPERPIWGSQRFVLRSTLALAAERELVHPQIAPRGRGAVDAYLGVVNATNRPLSTENNAGLQAIPYSSRFQAKEFEVDAGARLNAFRVAKESGTLRIPLPRNPSEPSDSFLNSARVDFADVMVAVMPDRSSIGRAVYETVPASGRLLSFKIPDASTLLWTTVDSIPATPRRSALGTWSIPLDDRRQSRIALIWKTDPIPSQSALSAWPVALPRAGAGSATTVVAISAPPDLAIQGNAGGLEPAAMARLEMARADWLARSIGDFITKIDRSSGRDHERLVSLLINHEMALRTAERSARWSDSTGAKIDRIEQDSKLILAARGDMAETIRKSGLDDDLTSASNYLGQAPSNPNRPLAGVPEPNEPDRIRFFGRPFTLIGVMPGVDEPPSQNPLALVHATAEDTWTSSRILAIVAMSLLLGIALVTTAIPRNPWIDALALVMPLGILGYVGGPLILAGGLSIAAIGWKTSDR
jgi:hypothetical protein